MVIDDDTVIRAGLPALIPPEVQVAAKFPSAEDYVHAPVHADVVLLDLSLSGTGCANRLQGGAAVEAVAAIGAPVLIYTNERRPLVLAGCLGRGARGVVHKAQPVEDLLDAVTRVAAGQVVVTTSLTGLAEAWARSRPRALSPRQEAVLRGRARGEPYKLLAKRLGISVRTVEEHMSVVNTKFADFLCDRSPADLERALGLTPGDLLGPDESKTVT